MRVLVPEEGEAVIKSSLSFEDGPLRGVYLHDVPAPIMLRVATAPDGTHRAVPGGTDARADELVCVYIARRFSSGFWDGRDPKSGRRIGGTMVTANYVLHSADPQPWQDQIRDAGEWSKWCEANREALTARHRELVSGAAR